MAYDFQEKYIPSLKLTVRPPDIIRSPKIYGAWRCAPNDNLSFGSHLASRAELSFLFIGGKHFEGNNLGRNNKVTSLLKTYFPGNSAGDLFGMIK